MTVQRQRISLALLAGVQVERLQRAAAQREQPGVGHAGGELQVHVPEVRPVQSPRRLRPVGLRSERGMTSDHSAVSVWHELSST